MALNFPSSPSLNQTYSFNNKTWVWNGSAWDLQSSGAINGIPIGNVSASSGNFTTLSAGGNITAGGFFIGNGSQLTGIATATSFTAANITGNVNLANANGRANLTATTSTTLFVNAGNGIQIDPYSGNTTMVFSVIGSVNDGTPFGGDSNLGFVADSLTQPIDDLGLITDAVTSSYNLDSVGNGTDLTNIFTDLLPNVNSTLNIGNSNNRWSNLFVGNISVANNVSGNIAVTGTVTTPVLIVGNSFSETLTVNSGNTAVNYGSFTLQPGQSGTLGSSAGHSIINTDYSIVAGSGISVTNSNNRVTISAVPNISITDTLASSTLYPVLTASTSGNLQAVNTANTWLSYNPNTGNLNVGNIVPSFPIPTQSGGTGQTRWIAGQDYLAPATSTTITATQVFAGSGANISLKILNSAELVQVVPVACTGSYNFYISGGAVQYATSNATANWQMYFGWNGANTLDSVMNIGDSVTCALLASQGSTAYYATAFYVDNTAVTPRWQGGTAPSGGNTNGVDAYVFQIIKTAAATFAVFASQTRFA